MTAASQKGLTISYMDNHNGLAWLGLAWLGLAWLGADARSSFIFRPYTVEIKHQELTSV